MIWRVGVSLRAVSRETGEELLLDRYSLENARYYVVFHLPVGALPIEVEGHVFRVVLHEIQRGVDTGEISPPSLRSYRRVLVSNDGSLPPEVLALLQEAQDPDGKKPR